MNIIGISGLHHGQAFKRLHYPDLEKRCYRMVQGFDSAAALVTNDGIQFVAAEERFTRDKATGTFPAQAIQFCLKSANLPLSAIDFIAHNFDYEPYRFFYEQSEYTRLQFDEVYCRDVHLAVIKEQLSGWKHDDRFVQVPHHLAHATSAFYPSGFRESLILVTDAMGEQHSCTVAIGNVDGIHLIKRIPAAHSLGVLYSLVTFHLGFEFAMDEYKVMGLAPYGNPRNYFQRLMDLVHLKEGGTYTIPILSRNRTQDERETYQGTRDALTELCGTPRAPQEEIAQHHKDIAAALQQVLQASLLHTLRHFRKETGQRNLCMAGGVALNCTANGVIRRSGLFRNVFVQPAAGDDGTSLGAALYVQRSKAPTLPVKKMGLPMWGPSYDVEDLQQALDQYRNKCDWKCFKTFGELATEVAGRLNAGQILGWFQGAMEFGPRALGHRSILADPRRADMRERLNRLVKKREAFRPFAPAVPLEDAGKYFEINPGDEALFEYMLCVTQVREPYRRLLPAITHVDGSARVQTVREESNRRFWQLLRAVGRIAQIPIVLNTSFNVRGQPIVCSPGEAMETFLNARLDALVLGDFLVERNV